VIAIGKFALTGAEVARRKRFLELTPVDEARLRDAHGRLQQNAGEIIEKFYEYLLAHEHTRSVLSTPGLIEKLKKLQAQYFSELTAGVYDLAYFENRLKVGLAHQRVGLSPEWYLGAYNKYLHIASDVLSRSYGRDYEGFFQTMTSLTKVIYLDMGLALDAYIHSAADQVEKLQAAKQQLTDMIVHDLQNPLAGIKAFLEFLGSKDLTPSEKEALEEALSRCDDLAQMIMNVLHVRRAESGKLETYVEDLDLAKLAREAADAFQLPAQRDGRTLRVETPVSVPVRTDQTLVRRILWNLLRNALRHTPKGTSITVRVGADRTVRVIDQGPGIPADVQPLLFETFGASALRSAGLRVDTGLGLAFCRAAAMALGGRISVESSAGKGTSFVLTLTSE
jgi:signal transduction histidine kinase